MPRNIRPKWLKLTEEINAVDYLSRGIDALEESLENKMAWKWVCLNLFNATYAFAICAIKGTNPARVMTPNGRKLIDFSTAINRAQDPHYANQQVLRLTDSQVYSLRRLRQEFRNQFEHYQPLSWSIELHALAEIVPDILAVIRSLALEVGNRGAINFSNTQQRTIRSLLARANQITMRHPIFIEIKQ